MRIPTRDEANRTVSRVVAAALAVHRGLGPGLLESTYARFLALELIRGGVRFEQECRIPILYYGEEFDLGHRVDFLVDDHLIVEIKAVDRLVDLHLAQVMTYLRVTGQPLGLLINFNTKLIKDGIRRVILSGDAWVPESEPRRGGNGGGTTESRWAQG